MKYKSVKKPDRCPECGYDRIAAIMYGLPSFSPCLKKKLSNNEIVLGGCCITNDDPYCKCIDCKTVIYRMEIDPKGSVN